VDDVVDGLAMQIQDEETDDTFRKDCGVNVVQML